MDGWEEGVVVEGHLGVEGEKLVVLGGDEGIDLQQRGVALDIGFVQALQKDDCRIDLGRLEPQGKGQLARLPRAKTNHWIDDFLEDGLGSLGRHDFDLHASGLRGHEDQPAGRAIEHNAEIKLAVDGRRLLDQQPLHLLALRTRLMRHQRHAEDVFGESVSLLARPGHFHAAAFSAASGMNLGFDDDARGALGKQFACHHAGFLQRVGHFAPGHGYAVFCQDFFCLIFMNLQGRNRPVRWSKGFGPGPVNCRAIGRRASGTGIVSGPPEKRQTERGRPSSFLHPLPSIDMASLKEFLKPLAEDGAALTREQASAALEEILSGGVPEVETAALVTVMATRGEQAPELAGFVDGMRRHVTPLPLTDAERDELVDVVGTGGGGPLTFNISSGAALVAAAAGAKVAKHGNRAVTSLCGAADVLDALGVPIELGPELAAECLRQTGFVFLYAPLYHPAMKAVGPLRRALGFRTIFNLCGPLTNPAGARAQVIGVLAPSKVLLVGRTLAMLGAKRAFVVHGTDGIDELTTTGESIVARIEESETGGAPTLKAARVTPEMAGLPRTTLDQFTGGDVKINAALLYDVLTGLPGARREIVLLNAAAALVAAGLAGDLKEGVGLSAEAIDSGQAAATLAKLRQFGEKYAKPQ